MAPEFEKAMGDIMRVVKNLKTWVGEKSENGCEKYLARLYDLYDYFWFPLQHLAAKTANIYHMQTILHFVDLILYARGVLLMSDYVKKTTTTKKHISKE